MLRNQLGGLALGRSWRSCRGRFVCHSMYLLYYRVSHTVNMSRFGMIGLIPFLGM